MLDGIHKEIELCKAKTRKISASEVDLMMNIEKLFKKTILEVEDHLPFRHERMPMNLVHRLTVPFKPIEYP